jgi:hypothetical protein
LPSNSDLFSASRIQRIANDSWSYSCPVATIKATNNSKETKEIGSDKQSGGPTKEDRQKMKSIRDKTDEKKKKPQKPTKP